MPLQILRPSIVVGDSRTGRTSSFNVLYGPLKAFARGAIPAIPARRSSPVDIVPVDYVAERTVDLADDGPNGTFHLVAGRNATTAVNPAAAEQLDVGAELTDGTHLIGGEWVPARGGDVVNA